MSKPTKVYSVEFPIHATAYIRAESESQAMAIAAKRQGLCVELPTDDVWISGKAYTDARLPVFSFSPAVTLGRPKLKTLELAQDNANREQN